MIRNVAAAMALAGSLLMAAGPGGPVPGYVLDSRSSGIRPVYGIPGALQLGASVALPFGVVSAAFGPAGDYAIVTDDEQPPHAWLIGTLAGTPAVTDLGVVAADAKFLAVNASGSAALLWSQGAGAVQFVSGLPQSPAVSAPVPTLALAGPITAAALDDAGACAILGTGALETLCTDGTTSRLMPQGLKVLSVIVANKGQDVLFADGAAQQVFMLHNFAQSPGPVVLASAADGIAVPVGIQVMDGGNVLVADAGASAVFVIDPTGAQSVIRISAGTAPSQLRPLTDRSILLLNDASAVPFTILDLQSMRTFFIPST